MNLARRDFLAASLAATGCIPHCPVLAKENASSASPPAAEDAPYDFRLEALGEIQAVSPLSLQASPLSVGFETLDRRHFEPARAYPHLEKLGAKWARCQTGWARTETKRGEFDFAWLDEVVDSLRKIGVQPWFNLGYGNRLYTPDASDEAAVGWAPMFSDAARTAWVRYTRKIAEHFRDRVRNWEIWNEPNITNFWKPQKPNAEDYVQMIKITAPEIRRIVPDAVIIGGAFAGIPLGYLEGCLKNGMAEHVDKISYHPYRPVPEQNYEKEIRAMREMIAQHKPGLEIWQGENGCPSQQGGAGALANLAWSETRQAKWLLRRILSDLRLDVELTSYFHTVDLVGYRGTTNHKGLLHGKSYTPKRAYRAYQCLCALFDSRTRRVGLETKLVGQEKVQLQEAAFERNGRAMYAWWMPANLQNGWTPRPITVRLAVAPKTEIREPVLIDLLTGRVFRFEAAVREGESLLCKDLPLLDYPLLLADRSLAV